ncbi:MULTISPECIES: DMT family transporter [unclassified Treponema]|uniref:DMT family transporter n=1 Tax=unclassified Treponema TaxID=2638727 RepID=UPI0020A2AB81|nr:MULTISPECIES: DMT family transporter [unclassified Treponema]UTC67541.1 DMT family transporter [Treponema sp. OMZ 789]UTC70269.1 DMT family transporter [Treponema sp. OMZ 790]UTC72984.1 DMT family transporter [Treponema sp. OMZ 791]
MTNKLKSYLAALTAIVFFASSFPFSRFALMHFGPEALGFLRCFLASLVLLIMGKFNKLRAPFKLKHIGLFFLSGALGFALYLIVFNIGLRTITAATSSIIIATTPILTAATASILYGEKISKLGYISILAAFCGVLIIILWKGILSINIGILWTVAAAVSFCGYNVLSRKLAKMGYTSIEIVTYSMICAAIILSPFSVEGYKELVSADFRYIGSLLYLGIFTSALGYFFFNKGIEIAEKTSDVTNFIFVNPLIASILSYFILGETLNAGTVIGGTIIIVSIIVFALKGEKKKTLESTTPDAEHRGMLFS